MRIDVTNQESLFASQMAGINVFVMNTFQNYETKINALIEEVEKLRESNRSLEKKLKEQEVTED